MVRFLHLADIHFDTQFLGRSASLRAMLKDAQRAAFSRAIGYAITEKLDFVAISGDLFDADKLSFATERFLGAEISRLNEAGIPCLYASGNHDPGGSRSRLRSVEWPANFIRILKGSPQIIPIYNSDRALLANVVGAGHESQAVEENLARNFPQADGPIPFIGLLHTFVTSAQSVESHDRYAPSTVADLEGKRYAYWALGHIHVRQKVDEAVEAWYPGILQGRNFKESGEKGGLVVTVHDSGSADVEFHAFSSVRWETLQLKTLESIESIAEFQSEAIRAYESTDPTRDDELLLRLELSGRSPLARQLAETDEAEELTRILTEELGVRHLELRTTNLFPNIPVDKFRGETHVLGEVLDVLEQAKADDNLLKRLKPGDLIGFEEQPEDLPAYLRDLLAGMDIEAVSRFVGDRHED